MDNSSTPFSGSPRVVLDWGASWLGWRKSITPRICPHWMGNECDVPMLSWRCLFQVHLGEIGGFVPVRWEGSPCLLTCRVIRRGCCQGFCQFRKSYNDLKWKFCILSHHFLSIIFKNNDQYFTFVLYLKKNYIVIKTSKNSTESTFFFVNLCPMSSRLTNTFQL